MESYSSYLDANAIPDLRTLFLAIPRSDDGIRDCIFLMTTDGIHFHFTMNLYCSLLSVKFPRSAILLVTLGNTTADLAANQNITAVNASKTVPPVKLTVLKLAFVHQLLLWNGRVHYIDSDVVCLQDPRLLWASNGAADFEPSAESSDPSFGPDYSSAMVNGGLWRISPTESAKKFLSYWFFSWVPSDGNDQVRLRTILENCPRTWLGGGLYRVHMSHLIGCNIVYRFLDPVLSVNANSIYCSDQRRKFGAEAAKRGIVRPVLFHMAHYWPTRKPSALAEKNLWFSAFPLTFRCKRVAPNGTANFWYRRYDLVNTTIPRDYPGLSNSNLRQ
jgi:hypothetical protein